MKKCLALFLLLALLLSSCAASSTAEANRNGAQVNDATVERRIRAYRGDVASALYPFESILSVSAVVGNPDENNPQNDGFYLSALAHASGAILDLFDNDEIVYLQADDTHFVLEYNNNNENYSEFAYFSSDGSTAGYVFLNQGYFLVTEYVILGDTVYASVSETVRYPSESGESDGIAVALCCYTVDEAKAVELRDDSGNLAISALFPSLYRAESVDYDGFIASHGNEFVSESTLLGQNLNVRDSKSTAKNYTVSLPQTSQSEAE